MSSKEINHVESVARHLAYYARKLGRIAGFIQLLVYLKRRRAMQISQYRQMQRYQKSIPPNMMQRSVQPRYNFPTDMPINIQGNTTVRPAQPQQPQAQLQQGQPQAQLQPQQAQLQLQPQAQLQWQPQMMPQVQWQPQAQVQPQMMQQQQQEELYPMPPPEEPFQMFADVLGQNDPFNDPFAEDYIDPDFFDRERIEPFSEDDDVFVQPEIPFQFGHAPHEDEHKEPYGVPEDQQEYLSEEDQPLPFPILRKDGQKLRISQPVYKDDDEDSFVQPDISRPSPLPRVNLPVPPIMADEKSKLRLEAEKKIKPNQNQILMNAFGNFRKVIKDEEQEDDAEYDFGFGRRRVSRKLKRRR
jgi:hypothetical protein